MLDPALEPHRDAVQRLCRDIGAVDSVAAILLEAMRRMIEARFELCSYQPYGIERAVACLDVGIAECRAALTDEDGEVALAAYLDAFDRWVAYPTALNRQTLDVARATWTMESEMEAGQLRLTV